MPNQTPKVNKPFGCAIVIENKLQVKIRMKRRMHFEKESILINPIVEASNIGTNENDARFESSCPNTTKPQGKAAKEIEKSEPNRIVFLLVAIWSSKKNIPEGIAKTRYTIRVLFNPNGMLFPKMVEVTATWICHAEG